MEKISLDDGWTLSHQEKSIKIPVQVPGTVFEALIENKIIDDPFYGLNELEMSWVYESDWQYDTNFDVEPDFLEHSRILLRFHGLDTITEVYLNGDLLGSTKNMFLMHEFEVKTKLQKGSNSLKIVFKSPSRTAREEIKKHGKKLRTVAALPGVPYLRKAQVSFGWDWGPRLPDIGIWKPVELVGFTDLKIAWVHTIQTFEYNRDPLEIRDPADIPKLKIEAVNLQVNLELTSDVEDLASLGYKISINLKPPDGAPHVVETPLKTSNQSVELKIVSPQIWWTHDLGTPKLYNLTVSITKESVIDSISQKIGIRDIRLIRNSDKWGETFYFMLNGIPIFAKGANWIPIDCFIPRGKKLGLYSTNLLAAQEANMNMIRVHGGGIYEDDEFYNLCDELGLLVWQDFLFACAIYPPHEEFVENVKKEAIQNIKRLRHHPSLALWCGNNEIEEYFHLYFILLFVWKPKERRSFKRGYLDMFESDLPDLVKEYDPQRSYWPSSPSNWEGRLRLLGFKTCNSPKRGDSHFWKVWHMGAPFTAYREFDSRFMSEYGFQSFPSIKTIKTFCPLDQFHWHSPIMEHHQKNVTFDSRLARFLVGWLIYGGNKKVIKYMKRRFPLPEIFQDQVILSQITHGEALEYGIEHWRRNRNEFHCMGSLYWQLNDCWPVASWATVDYLGRWKAAHYIMKRNYQPFIASVEEEDKNVKFWLTNDLRTPRKGTLTWKILTASGETLLSGTKNATILPCSSLNVEKVDVSNINRKKSDRRNNIIFYSLTDDENNATYHGFRLFDSPKYFSLEEPEINYDVKEINEKNLQVTISAKKMALYTFIESEVVDFIASDNYFSLEPGQSRVINLKISGIDPDEKTSREALLKSFRVRSLYDLIRNSIR